jgi:hypothetical protein
VNHAIKQKVRAGAGGLEAAAMGPPFRGEGLPQSSADCLLRSHPVRIG